MNKRGISGVVATVLIVLVTVAAITIIWITIIPTIQEKLETINMPEADIEIDTTRGYTGYSSSSRELSVNVKKGPNNVNISKIKFIVETNGSSETFTQEVVLLPGQSKVFYIPLDKKPDYVLAVPVIKIDNVEKDGKPT